MEAPVSVRSGGLRYVDEGSSPGLVAIEAFNQSAPGPRHLVVLQIA